MDAATRERYTVRFSFQLPGTLLLRAPIGMWPRAPRGVTVEVAPDGFVDVACVDGSELHGRGKVIRTTAAFIRSIDKDAPAMSIAAAMKAPSLRGSSVAYAISIGCRVSIARTGDAPAVFGNPLLEVVPG